MRLATWNAQGDAFGDMAVKRLMTDNDIDILCLQECGSSSSTYLKEEGINGCWRMRYYDFDGYYYPWGDSNCRCSMAILAKSDYQLADGLVIDPPDFHEIRDPFEEPEESERVSEVMVSKGLRGLLLATILVNDKHYAIGCVHLPSGCPSFALKVWKEFRLEVLNRPEAAMVLGDFNIPLPVWHKKMPMQGLYRAQTPTYPSNANYLDYLYAPALVLQDELYGQTLDLPKGSDHLPVCFDVAL